MGYLIKTTTSNGYRCSCCGRDWDSTEFVDTLEEALEQVPVKLVDDEPHPFNQHYEIQRVKVTDGSTGEEVAWASATCPGYRDDGGYSYTDWSGYRPDVGAFRVLYDGRAESDKTWAEVVDALKERKRTRELAKAQRDLAQAQRMVSYYS